ncbi:LOW QUALITY PROTEIN: histone-lysine N-methyltransferase SETDB1-like [Dermacentor silvarum]|uniref:LOW QUALITY PROTEIN: histone-lysine N-methyltransferase SETDB1-like n=1 Tax=Dermacentor silvarum TaxID=543639 RepID=UPI002101C85F|nr:LOW QUALITY PROTEIN: histone-lysine N-methyltransferase SETDB1-like [Dermacentor silvarum]
MTLAMQNCEEKEVAGGHRAEDINGDGLPEAKRMRLDDNEQYFVCDCDILGTIDSVVSALNVEQMFKEDVWKEEVRKFSNGLCNIDKLERDFIHVDIAFDKMERDLQKLKEKKSLEEKAMLSPPELHFFDVFVNADRSFKKPDATSPRRPAPSLTTHSPRNSATTSRTPTSSDEIISVGPVGKYTPAPHNLPPEGPIVRKELDISSKVLATRNFPLGVFYKARIIQIQDTKEAGSEPTYRVKFETRKANASARALKWYPRREMAYAERAAVILPVGTRVVATYSDESVPPRQSLYAGLIAEPPKPLNRYRYLVFFDDGYAQYVDIDKVFVMCGSSRDVWEDMYRDVRDFVRSYLEKYPERPMLRLRKGQTVKTEWNGSWWMARVLTVDSSLVKMSFEADNRTEWIYRGSTRFAPLYTALNQPVQNTAAAGGRVRRHNLVPVANKQHRPFVQWSTLEDEPAKSGGNDSGEDSSKKVSARNVARKSTTHDRKVGEEDDAVRNAFGVLLSQAGTRELRLPNAKDGAVYKPKLYKTHQCAPGCLKEDDPEAYLGKNPFSIPCLLGWQRQIVKQSKKSKRRVAYVAPCGRRLRDITEVAHYLNLCKSLLTVDLFCFDSLVNVFCEFVPETVRTYVEDITYGKEQVPVTSVNSVDDVYPTFVEYSSKRYPGKGVQLNLDPNFLCGCDCEDDCQDREKCSCQQLTVAATEALPSGRNPTAGYHYRRLQEPLITGVYECNSQCHCSRRCYNRVVQNGLRARLQIFKTEKRGWGIRCLDDLPQGSFICVYSGQLLNEQAANEDGNQYGDEYLAELDHIEVVEKQKEGYESDVVPASDDDSDKSVDEEEALEGLSDSDYDSGGADIPRKRSTRVRKQRVPPLAEDSSDSKANDDEDSTSNDEAQKVNGTEKEEDAKRKTSRQNSPEKSGDDESSDSKSTEDKPSDAAGEESQSSTKSENGKPTKKQKKQTGNKGVIAKPTAGPLDGPSSGGDSQPPKLPSTRSFFNEEFCYIMDAKNCGNIGRYLNHSCSPNVYVQNVFVDTHDLRFPWVAFFAARYIRAGVELTWDYNYDVGSVPERVMYCQCGSDECRGRLI